MNNWNSLSMQKRAEVMKLAIENGIYDLDTIRKGYNEFAKGGRISNYYDGWGDTWNYLKKGVQKARQKVRDWGLDKSPAAHILSATGVKDEDLVNKNQEKGNNLGFISEGLLDMGRISGLNKRIKGSKDDIQCRQNIYNLVDPTTAIPRDPKDIIGFAKGVYAASSNKSYPYQRTYTDATADAAWAKRLALDYDKSALIDNEDGSVRLPLNVEAEIPTDTLFLKDRIAANEKRLKKLHGKERELTGYAIDYDKDALEALRKTYKTGKPVEMNEFSHNSRNWQGKTIDTVEPTPLNTLHRYTIQYDKNNNTMNYWDWYNFNEFEDFVPGEPFRIKGSIDLNKKK